jgi:hypothetical protein
VRKRRKSSKFDSNSIFSPSIHYKTPEKSEHLRVRNLIPKMSVAAFHGGQWQRAEVIIVCHTKALVRFVDTTKSDFVDTKNIRYLEKTFAMSPQKACRGSLAGVMPRNNELLFDDEAIEEFRKKVKGVKMFAVVKGEFDEVFKLSLFEDSAKMKKVADQLIARGLIVKDPEEDMSVNAILV